MCVYMCMYIFIYMYSRDILFPDYCKLCNGENNR